jgi:hypothetical protein
MQVMPASCTRCMQPSDQIVHGQHVQEYLDMCPGHACPSACVAVRCALDGMPVCRLRPASTTDEVVRTATMNGPSPAYHLHASITRRMPYLILLLSPGKSWSVPYAALYAALQEQACDHHSYMLLEHWDWTAIHCHASLLSLIIAWATHPPPLDLT